MLFIGPTLLSGIGQVVNKYCKLLNGQYLELSSQSQIPSGQDVFIFALPIPYWIEQLPIIIQNSKSVICMTVCETEPVHEAYGELFNTIGNLPVAVPSEFCKRVFSTQFPNTTFKVLHHYVPLPKYVRPPKGDPYIFYHIGNISDPRKNCKKILEAFLRLNLPDSYLVLKATCKTPVTWNLPRVQVINGLLPDESIQAIHETCHCYVSFSNSEGAGMGAIEAALNDRPVIITEYGAPVEYIKTPYTIPCGRQLVGQDDFLFKKEFSWGRPSFEKLLEFMQDAYDKRLYKMNHSHTKNLVSSTNIISEFTSLEH